jgi:hypothetical protein
MKIQSIRLLPGANITCIDASGREMPNKYSLLTEWAGRAEKDGLKIDGIICETAEGNYRLVKEKQGWVAVNVV